MQVKIISIGLIYKGVVYLDIRLLVQEPNKIQ